MISTETVVFASVTVKALSKYTFKIQDTKLFRIVKSTTDCSHRRSPFIDYIQ